MYKIQKVDLPYFEKIRENVKKNVVWKVVWYKIKDRKKFRDTLTELGIPEQFIETVSIKKLTRK